MRRALAIALVTISLSMAGAAHAESRTSSLSWVRLPGADACVATQDLARDVEERLGRTVFVSAAQADVSVEGHIEPRTNAPGFHAVVSIRDAKGALLGTRELARPEPSCNEMRAPLALIIAVMIDPDAAMKPRPNPQDPPPAQQTPEKQPDPVVIVKKETVYVPVPGPPPDTTPKERPSEPWRGDVDASFTIGLGLVPSVGLGVSAMGVLEPPHFQPIELHGTYYFDTDASADRGARATFSLAEGGIGLCPMHVRPSRFTIFGCMGFDAGVLRAHSVGFDTAPADDTRLFIAPIVHVRAAVKIAGPLEGTLRIAGLLPLGRDSFVYDRPDGTKPEIFRQSVIAGAASVGLGAAF